MTVLELDTGLFPDADTLDAGLAAADGAKGRRLDIRDMNTTDEAGWDRVVSALMEADLVVTL